LQKQLQVEQIIFSRFILVLKIISEEINNVTFHILHTFLTAVNSLRYNNIMFDIVSCL